MNERVDPEFPRYRIPETTIDAPYFAQGAKVVLKLECTVAVEPHSAALGNGMPIVLRIDDWAGPRRAELDPGPIPEALLAACASRVADALVMATLQSGGPADPRDLAQAVLEEIGRRLHPSDSEAVTLVLGVARLDIEKLARAGDRLASEVDDRRAHEWVELRQIYGPKAAT